jgi:hypothetical protein
MFMVERLLCSSQPSLEGKLLLKQEALTQAIIFGGMVLARVQKWILQPIGTFWRVLEKLGMHYDDKIIAI